MPGQRPPRTPAMDGWSPAPGTRGRIARNVPLAARTWLRAGGPAECLFVPADPADLGLFLAGLPARIPFRVIGLASNLLVRDGGLPGVTIRPGRHFATITREGHTIIAGGAAPDMTVATHAALWGLGGLEFLCGIPGSIGGGVAMNAGAFGACMADVLIRVEIVDRTGERTCLAPEDLGLSYRSSCLPADAVVTRVWLRGTPAPREQIGARMADIRATRRATQPPGARTGGSVFRNPPPELAGGRKAWELIDAAGGRGLRRGDAKISEQHCNFLVNMGRATAAELEDLGEEVRRMVHGRSGVGLEWEIRRIGNRCGEGE